MLQMEVAVPRPESCNARWGQNVGCGVSPLPEFKSQLCHFLWDLGQVLSLSGPIPPSVK